MLACILCSSSLDLSSHILEDKCTGNPLPSESMVILLLIPNPESEAVILNPSLDRKLPSSSRTATLLLLNLVLPFCSAL
ncbi:hypothetical protein EJB05_17507, partial [Eragrostis curvula]